MLVIKSYAQQENAYLEFTGAGDIILPEPIQLTYEITGLDRTEPGQNK